MLNPNITLGLEGTGKPLASPQKDSTSERQSETPVEKPIPTAPQVSKRQRFEIFKRDSFTCLYCGRKPPLVILNVDHIIPRSKGGDNSPTNLLTSCRECNQGKSDVPLSELPLAHQQTVEDRQERLDQLKAMADLCLEEQLEHEKWFSAVSAHWTKLAHLDPDEWALGSERAIAIRKFLRLLSLDEVLESVSIAFERYGDDGWMQFKFFCGVCWRKIKSKNPRP